MAIILFVEDDAVSRRSIAFFLRASGYEVHETDNGETALEPLLSVPFDVGISDLNLPGQLNGLDILDALKTIPRKIDAILITGRGSDDIQKELLLLVRFTWKNRFSYRNCNEQFSRDQDSSDRSISASLHFAAPVTVGGLPTAQGDCCDWVYNRSRVFRTQNKKARR